MARRSRNTKLPAPYLRRLTLRDAGADLPGDDEVGGGKAYHPVDLSGADLGDHFRAGWLPKVTDGWFFRAESFFSVARHLDEVHNPAADFLSWSHGEGFVRFFKERTSRQGIYFKDEPESALSPKRQLELLRLLNAIQEAASAQVILATHSPLLMAVPGAQLLCLSHRGIDPIHYRDTDHFRLYQSSTVDAEDFIAHALRDDPDAMI